MQNFKILLFAFLLLESIKTQEVSVTITPASTTVGEEPIYDFSVTPSTSDQSVCIKITFDEPTFVGAAKGITTTALLTSYITSSGFSSFAVFDIDTTFGLYFIVSVTTFSGTTATMQLPVGSVLNPGSAIESTYTVTTYSNKGTCTTTLGSVQTGTINYTPSELVFDTDVYITLATNPINGDENTMTFSIDHQLDIPTNGYVTIQMPKRFVGTTSTIVYLKTLDSDYSVTSITNTAGTLIAGTDYSLDETIQPSSATADTLEIKILKAAGIDNDDAPLIITIDNLNYPYSTDPLTGFIISTQSSDGVDIEQCTDAEIETSVAGTMTGASMSVSSDTVNEDGVTYTFFAKAVNQIPDGASFWIDYSGSDATHTTTTDCALDLDITSNTKMSASTAAGCSVISSTGFVKYDKIWTADDSTGTINIAVSGWTNPPSSATQTFTILIYDIDTTYVIDSVSVTYEFSPVVLVIKTFEPGDGDYGVNSVPEYYDVWIKIQADIESDYQIRITFPVAYYYFDEDTSGCDAEDFDIGEADDCTISITTDEDSDDNEFQSEITILIEGFTTTDDEADTNYKFTLTDVRNPFIRFEQIETLMFEILDADDNAVQLGYYTVGKFKVQPSMLSAFTVTPTSTKTGVTTSYIVKMEPVGIVPQKATIYLYYPEDVNPAPNRLLKDRCGQSTAEDFANDDQIACRYRESENLIIIEDGFESWNSQDFPEIEFDLPVVQNPRSTKPTSAFKAEFYDEDMNLIYYWNKTTAPILKMTSAGPPTQIYFTRLSTQNGNRTTYTFYVKNSQAYDEGDLVTLTLPASMNFTANSKCEFLQGFDKSTACKVSANLQSVYFNSKFSSGRRLESNGEVGSKWVFEVTDVRNPYSLKESASISYIVKTSDGFDIEGESAGLTVTNDEPGLIPYQTAYVLPSTFDRSTKSNYTLYFEPMNFETGMSLTIKIPEDLSLDASDKKFCMGISGVDSTVLDCKWDLKAKTVTFSTAWKLTYYIPKDIQLSFGPLMNPSQKIMTKSFNISTTTADGFALDSLAVNLQVSFSCTFPCATCTTASDSKCLSCYSKKDFKYLYSQYCYAECPAGTYETEFNTCAKCSPNCLTCDTSSNYCTSCESFYYLNKKKHTCETASFYPFPFIIASFLMTLATSLTILIRRDTKFRESVVALLSWVEIALWIVCCVLMGGTQQLLIILAVILHLVMNGFFGVVHEKYIFPNADAYYQEVIMTENKKHARFVIITSFIFTFKFHHILLSNFGQSERYSGDFSRESWIIWNKFALVYLLGIYPVSVIAGVLGIMEAEGPLDSFLGIELLVVSGYMSFLLLVCLKTYIGTFGPCARLACCKRYFAPKGDYVPRFRPPQKKEVYDVYGPNDSKAELMDIQKFKSPLQTPGEEQKDDIFPKNLIEEDVAPKEEYQIKVTRRESERIDQNSDGEQISEPKMLERMQKERKRLKMLKEQLNSEQKLKKNEQTKLIKETQNQVDIKQKTGHRAHGIEDKSSKIQSEHKGLILDRQEFLNEMDRRIEKKLEEWTEIQNIRHLIKRENTQSSLLSNNLKDVSHLASPERSVYDDDRSGMKNRTQDLHALKNLATDHSQVSPDVNKSRQDPIKSSMKASPYNQGKSSKMDKGRVHDEGSVENQSVHTLKSNNRQRVAPDMRASQEQKFDQAQKSMKSGKPARQNEPTDEDEIIRREMEENEMIGDQSMPPGDDPRGTTSKGASAKDSPLKGSPQKNKSNLGQSLKSGQDQYENQVLDPATGEPLAKTPGRKAVKGAPTRNSQIEPFREDASQGPNVKSMKGVTGNPALEAARGEASVEGGKSEKGRAQGQNRLFDPVTGEPTEDNRTIQGSRKDHIAQLAEEADMPIMPEDMRKSQKGVPGKQEAASQKSGKKDASPLNKNDPLKSNLPGKSEKSNVDPVSQKGGKSEKSLPGKSEKSLPGKSQNNQEQPAKSGEQQKEADRDSLKGDATPPAKKKNKRVVIYSDKSESSIEELMEDTPSNYNIPNGRLDGKSIGLKAIFMHAQKMGISIPDSQVKALEERQKNNLEAVQEEQEVGPKRGNPLNNLTHLMDSSDASWQPGNRRFNGAIDETINSNIDGESVEQFGKKKKAPIQKKFQEPPHNRGGSNQTTLARNSVSKPLPISKNSSKANDEGARAMKKNNFV